MCSSYAYKAHGQLLRHLAKKQVSWNIFMLHMACIREGHLPALPFDQLITWRRSQGP
jgi:hypothetical protein